MPADVRELFEMLGNWDGRGEPTPEVYRYLFEESMVDQTWEDEADLNGDGWVDIEELRLFLRSQIRRAFVKARSSGADAQARTFRYAVGTETENRYDFNGDGYLDGPELKALVEDKLRVVDLFGRSFITTQIEREFDANRDGKLSRDEAEEMARQLRRSLDAPPQEP